MSALKQDRLIIDGLLWLGLARLDMARAIRANS
jgi:hypothetical protein